MQHLIPWVNGLLVMLLYLVTTQRTVGAYDSAELAAGSAVLGIVHAPGYPLYLLFGHLFSYLPVGEVAFRINVMSGVFAALSVACLTAYLYRLTGDMFAALFAALAFGLCGPVWHGSVVAEVYTLQVLIISASLLLTQHASEAPSFTRIAALALVFGLTLAHRPPELMVGAGLLAVMVFSPARDQLKRPAVILPALMCLFSGLLWYVYLPLRAASEPVLNYALELQVDLTTPGGLWWMVSGAMFQHLAFAYPPGDYVQEMFAIGRVLWQSWYGVGVLLGLSGLAWLLRERRIWAAAILLMLIPQVIFYAGYRVADKGEMLLPLLLIWSLCISAGITAIRSWWPQLKPFVTGAGIVLLIGLAAVNYPQVDLSRDSAVQEQAEIILRQAAPDALILAEWSAATPLKYMQAVEEMRLDVQVFDWGLYGLGRLAYYRENGIPGQAARRFMTRDLANLIFQAGAERPVYSVDVYPILSEYFTLTPAGDLVRVEPLDNTRDE